MKNKDFTEERLLTTHQVGTLLQVDPKSILKWVTEGRLVGFRTPGGHHRIRAGDLVTFLRENCMPIPRSLRDADKRRLLVVDDDRRVLDGIELLLRPYSDRVDVRTVEDGIDALVQVGAFSPHVVLLDVVMPGIDGIEVCRRFQEMELTRSVRVVVFSAHLDEDRKRDALAAGAYRCIEKPVGAPEVLELLGVHPEGVPLPAP